VLRCLGYQTLKQPLYAPEGAVLDLGALTLEEAANRLAAITVNASRLRYDPRAAGATTFITPRTIKAIQPVGTEEVLRLVPGLNIVGDMGISNRPNISIRGSWGRRSKKVLLLEDGSYIAPAPYIAPGAYYNPPADRVEAVQVIKGAETLLYGPNNAYGVVNYITRRPPAEPEVGLRFSGGQRGWAMGQASYGGTFNQPTTAMWSSSTCTASSTSSWTNARACSSSWVTSGRTTTPPSRASPPLSSTPIPLSIPLMPTSLPRAVTGWTSHTASGWNFNSKVYGADFARDWWRQKTAIVRAEDVRAYVGETIYQNRYTWLDGVESGPDDWVRVGRIANGREATTDSRWNYTFAGAEEQVEKTWTAGTVTGDFVAGARFHREVFLDRFIENDSSRWARSGTTTLDLRYDLWSAAVWAKQRLAFGERFSITPIARMEHVDMVRVDLLAAAQLPGLGAAGLDGVQNSYSVLLPGLAADYAFLPDASGQQPAYKLQVFASHYRGFIAPSKVFGFLVERNGVIEPVADANAVVNMRPELSWNSELGFRGYVDEGTLSWQMAAFHNLVEDLYAGGRNEVFERLGSMRIMGLELGLDLDLNPLLKLGEHRLSLHGSLTALQSEILSGELYDRDLASGLVHSSASLAELLDRLNADPGVTAYVLNEEDERVPLDGPIAASDLDGIDAIGFAFGEGENTTTAQAPYTPPLSLHTRLGYGYKGLDLGLEGHYIAAQYTAFANFENESADGAIGRLPAYTSWDAQVHYALPEGKHGSQWQFFVVGKNLTNNVFRASRLNRATSGVFPGGFRQVHGGVALTF
jgi:Fe(3+) dicitrate transport protein